MKRMLLASAGVLLGVGLLGAGDAQPGTKAAKEEMARSKFDRDHDGKCDAAVCRGLRLLVNERDDGRVGAARAMTAQLDAIGMRVKVDVQDQDTF